MKFIPRILADTDPKNWQDATYWLAYTLIGGLTPIWCGYLFLRIFSQHPTWDQFTEHGEFALYTAAIIAPAFHTVSRELKVPGLRGRSFFLIARFCSMFVAVCVYVAVSCTTLSVGLPTEIDQSFLRWLTIGLFLSTTLLAFLITVLDYARLSSDLRQVVAGQEQDLKDEFKHLRDQK